MANKTAMQEMLEWTRKTFPMDLDTPRMIEDKIESLLKLEKEQIINAIDAGHRSTYSICEEGCAANMFGLRMDESAQQYYNETYGKI